jgi:16S rRNA (guanine527-N7)-methyltransferase
MNSVVGGDGALTVSRETRDRLEVFAATLTRWAPRINLVSRSTLDDLWLRHIADSAQLFDLAPDEARLWVDLGSGGGLPAAVIAALASERRPALKVVAIESDLRKCAFLREAARAMEVGLDVVAMRIEDAPPMKADVVSARALAPLPRLLELAEPFLAGVGLFPKGARHNEEIAAARHHWRFDHRTLRSRTETSAAIIEIRRLRRASD